MNTRSTDFTIDGSIGGGSVLRVAVPIAIALNKSINVKNIRKNRTKPGLRFQHLAGLELLTNISNYTLQGATVGSNEIIAYPKSNSQNKREVFSPLLVLKTAASVSLVIQALVNYSFASRKAIEIRFRGGGSHTDWSPNFDYLEFVAKPMYELFGIEIDMVLHRIGFYPKGGAKGKIKVIPSTNPKIQIEKGDLKHIKVISKASKSLQKSKVAERQIKGFISELKINQPIIEYVETSNPGTSCTAIMNYSNSCVKGASTLGKRGIPAEEIGKNAAIEALHSIQSNAAVDQYMADQLVPALAFAPSGSSYTMDRITDHVKTNLSVIEQILGSIIKLKRINNLIRLSRI